MTDSWKRQIKAAQELAQLTHQAPLLAACAMPVSDAQIRILDEMELFSRQWFDRQRAATHSTCETVKALAVKGYSDPSVTAQCLSAWSAGVTQRMAEEMRAGMNLWMCCTAQLAKGVATSGVVGAKVAKVVAPMPAKNHSTPV